MSLFILGFISLVLNICLYLLHFDITTMCCVFMVEKHWLYYSTFPLIIPVSYVI